MKSRLLAWLLEHRVNGENSALYSFADACVCIDANSNTLDQIDEVVRPFFQDTGSNTTQTKFFLRECRIPQWILTAFNDADDILIQQIPWPERNEVMSWWGKEVLLDDGCRVVYLVERQTLCAIWATAGIALVVGEELAMTGQILLKDLLGAANWPNALTLHAAAIEYDGKAIAFLGDSGVGKTTISLCCSLAENCKFISSERILVWQQLNNKEFSVLGWPSRLTIADGTLGRPELQQNGLSNYLQCHYHVSVKNKRVVPVTELSQFGITFTYMARPLSTLVFPSLVEVSSESGNVVSKLSHDEAVRNIQASTLSWPEEGRPHWTKWFTEDRNNPNTDKIILALASDIPCYSLKLVKDEAWPFENWMKKICQREGYPR